MEKSRVDAIHIELPQRRTEDRLGIFFTRAACDAHTVRHPAWIERIPASFHLRLKPDVALVAVALRVSHPSRHASMHTAVEGRGRGKGRGE